MPEAGQHIAHYRLIERIGEGGMGEVWRAEDTRLDRPVALKVLKDEAAGDAGRLIRFEREAKAVAALNHPNIVTLYSVDEADGIRFLTMELVEGRSLRERIAGEPMPAHDLLAITAQITEAVAAAHARGIVHRDLKPDNVMVSAGGRVKVLDFGMAKLREDEPLVDGEDSLSPTRTQAGILLGTLAYMSPEQAQGQPADARSDVFSTGIMLYEMATGRRPFPGNNPMAILSSVIKDPTPSLGVVHGIPPRLDRIVRRCLEKDPEARYPSARELCDDLQALREETLHESLLSSRADLRQPAPGANVLSRPGPAKAARRILTAVAGLAVIAAVVMAAWMFRGREQIDPITVELEEEPSVAILPFVTVDEKSDSQAFGDGIQDDLIMRASRIRSMKVISRTSVMRFRGSHEALAEIARELGVSTLMEGSVRRAGNRVRVNVKLVNAGTEETLWGDTFDRELTARDIFAIQSEIVEQVAVALEATLTPTEREAIGGAPTENLEAYTAYHRGMALDREAPNEANLSAKVEVFQAAVDRDPALAEAWARLSRAHIQIYWRGFDHSPERRERARTALERAEALRQDLPETATARGFYRYWGFRDYPAALASFEEAERGLPNDAAIIAAKSFMQRRMGRWDESLATLRRALSLDPLNLYLLENLRNSYQSLRRWEEVRRVENRIAQIDPGSPAAKTLAAASALAADGDTRPIRAIHETVPQVAIPLTMYPVFLLDRDYDAALAFVQTLDDDVLQEQTQWRPRTLLEGEIHWLAGRQGKARPLLEAAEARCREEIRQNPDDPRLYAALGLSLAYLGKNEDAEQEGERAVELLPYSRDAMDAGAFVFELAQIQAIAGRRDAALATLKTYLDNPGFLDVGYLARDPRLASLHDEPGFAGLMKQHRSP